jgi:transcriptional regulator with XRE-family HTH domain
MRKSRVCSSLDKLGGDIKSARTALHLTRRDLAEQVGIDPRYLANIENSGSMPSLPIFYELVRICKLPLERYFFDVEKCDESEQRQRINQKLAICNEEFLPVVEGTLDGVLQVQDEQKQKE